MPCSNPNLIDLTKGKKFLGSYKTYADAKGIPQEEVDRAIKQGRYSKVPCGKCEECCAARANNWGTRCELEGRYYQQNLFITLTYDDEHLPIYNATTGEHYRGLKNPIDYALRGKTYERPNLCKKDLTLFMKRLNKEAVKKGYSETGKSCRYFACGEYGERGFRPHYHVIIFGLQPPDLEAAEAKKEGQRAIQHYRSAWIAEKWGMGIVDIEEGNFGSARYVAGYIAKKHKDKGFYDYMGLVAPYNVMSRKPGIGATWWADNREKVYDSKYHDKIYLEGGKAVKPPRYFDKLEDRFQLALEADGDESKLREWLGLTTKETENGEAMTAKKKSAVMKEIGDHRKAITEGAERAKLHKTTVTPIQYAEIEHEAYLQKPGWQSIRRRGEKL